MSSILIVHKICTILNLNETQNKDKIKQTIYYHCPIHSKCSLCEIEI